MRNLFELEEQESDWKKEWKDMPEFVQINKEPFQKIVISFETYNDVLKFAELLGCSVTKKTKSIWFPLKNKEKPKEYSYVDTNK